MKEKDETKNNLFNLDKKRVEKAKAKLSKTIEKLEAGEQPSQEEIEEIMGDGAEILGAIVGNIGDVFESMMEGHKTFDASKAGNVRNATLDEALAPLLKEVEDSASEGHSSIDTKFDLTDKTENRLRDLGFTLKKHDSSDSYTLSW